MIAAPKIASRPESHLKDIRHYLYSIRSLTRKIDDEVDALKDFYERDIQGEMILIFDAQIQEIEQNLEQFRGADWETRAKLFSVDRLLDFPRWIRETANRLIEHIRGAWNAGFRFGSSQVDLADEIFLPDVVFDRFLDDLNNDQITQFTRDEMERLVRQALEEQWDVDRMRHEMTDLFDGWKDWRSRRIAVTNVTPAFAKAQLEAFRLAGIRGKKWRILGDLRVRDTHRTADGQIQPLNRPFRVGGGELDYPGDPKVRDLSLIINCRCFIEPSETI